MGRARSAASCAALLVVAACGDSGKDRSFELPAGTELDATRAAQVLVVVEASNACGASGTCVPLGTIPTSTPSPPDPLATLSPHPDPTPSPPPGSGGIAACDLGRGNTRGLAVYRLGPSGLLASDTPEQTIATGDNPRRVVAHPNLPGILYVATLERVQVIRLQAGGGSRCIDQTLSEREFDPQAEDDLDPIDLAIDGTTGNGVLYVAAAGTSRVDAYAIAADGTLPDQPTSCIVGPTDAEFAALAAVGDGLLVAGGRTMIAAYARQAGQFPPPTANPGATPTPSPALTPACFGGRIITEPVSAIGAAFITDLFFSAAPEAPLGQLFVAEEVSRKLFTFPIDGAGVIDEDESSGSARIGVYQNMLRADRGGASIVYATVFNEGRVDVFLLENGLLPTRTFSRTAEDPDALPVGLTIDGPAGAILYVAQGGLGRVDGFRIRVDGGLESLPATSTRLVETPDGALVDTFPDDVLIVDLP